MKSSISNTCFQQHRRPERRRCQHTFYMKTSIQTTVIRIIICCKHAPLSAAKIIPSPALCLAARQNQRSEKGTGASAAAAGASASKFFIFCPPVALCFSSCDSPSCSLSLLRLHFHPHTVRVDFIDGISFENQIFIHNFFFLFI